MISSFEYLIYIVGGLFIVVWAVVSAIVSIMRKK
jgi:hypothetical protein